MLPDGKAQRLTGTKGESEAEEIRVVRQLDLFHEGQVYPFPLERRFKLCDFETTNESQNWLELMHHMQSSRIVLWPPCPGR